MKDSFKIQYRRIDQLSCDKQKQKRNHRIRRLKQFIHKNPRSFLKREKRNKASKVVLHR